MTAGQAIVLNGTSSAGKTTLGRVLQDRLDGWWLLVGVDTLITAMPWRMYGTPDGHTIRPDGTVEVGPGWRRTQDQWRASIATLLRAGANVLLDEVFLEGGADQARWQQVLEGLEVTWVGVHCDVEVAAAREAARGDRSPHMARAQAAVVHEGVAYDVRVDTSAQAAEDVADLVIAALRDR